MERNTPLGYESELTYWNEFRESHSFTRTGLLFHIPTPTPALNLHLTITRLHPETWPPAEEDKDDPKSTEPFLVELQPARPVQAVPSRGEVGLQDTMRFMRTAAGRVDGLEWSTGR